MELRNFFSSVTNISERDLFSPRNDFNKRNDSVSSKTLIDLSPVPFSDISIDVDSISQM